MVTGRWGHTGVLWRCIISSKGGIKLYEWNPAHPPHGTEIKQQSALSQSFSGSQHTDHHSNLLQRLIKSWIHDADFLPQQYNLHLRIHSVLFIWNSASHLSQQSSAMNCILYVCAAVEQAWGQMMGSSDSGSTAVICQSQGCWFDTTIHV